MMRILLDTHILLWWYAGTELDDTVVAQIADPDTLVSISAASVWEMRIKQKLGKLGFPAEMLSLLDEDDIEQLPISWKDGWAAGALPHHHRDPFDRMLIAQAQTNHLTLLSRDQVFSKYDGFDLQLV